jgi:uncharacterized membrane protein YphA (DoxX/SURF4 family)
MADWSPVRDFGGNELGAGGLGVLTAVALLTANNFWAMSGHDPIVTLNAFFEQLGVIAGFLFVSVMAAYAASTILNGSTPFHRGFR